MLDSGANARVTYVKQLDPTRGVGSVTLASGSTAPCSTFMGPKGMPNVQIAGASESDILPLYWLIERNCAMSNDFLTFITPKNRHLPVIKGDDELLYLSAKSVTQLFEDLPEADERGRSGAPALSTVNVAFSMRLKIAALRVNGGTQESRELHVGSADGGLSTGDIGYGGAADMGHVLAEDKENQRPPASDGHFGTLAKN